MNLLQVGLNTLLGMPPEDKISFILNGTSDEGSSCEYALLLGAPLDEAKQRALYSAKLYCDGRIRYIISSGGVTRDNNGEKISECDFMARILKENNVPEAAIIIENEALTTRENMIYGALRLNRITKLIGVEKIMIITSAWHMKRSLALAECFLPRKLSVCGSPVPLPKSNDEWLSSEENMLLIDDEIRFIKKLIDNRIISDMEVKMN